MEQLKAPDAPVTEVRFRDIRSGLMRGEFGCVFFVVDQVPYPVLADGRICARSNLDAVVPGAAFVDVITNPESLGLNLRWDD